MAVESSTLLARGDRVAIVSRDANTAPVKSRIATVTYVGQVYIRLSDGSAYSTIGLESLRGNENTRIELITEG
jgi:hypothetical protein